LAHHEGMGMPLTHRQDAIVEILMRDFSMAFLAVLAAFVMRDKSHHLPSDAFKTKIVVAAIHRGKAMWKYKVEGIEAQDRTLIVRSSTTSTPSETASFACPLIVSLDKGDYTAVQFVENDKAVKKVEMGGATTQPAGPGSLESFKGWELYVWQDKGETFCSFMLGTNWGKSDDMIGKAAVKGIEAAKARLAELKAGQFVTIMGRNREQQPPQDAARELADYCKQLGLKAQ
jgi:hypothetical protein